MQHRKKKMINHIKRKNKQTNRYGTYRRRTRMFEMSSRVTTEKEYRAKTNFEGITEDLAVLMSDTKLELVFKKTSLKNAV